MLNFSPTKQIHLRDYQDAAIDALRQSIRQGNRRVILSAGTGAGKTVIAASLLKEADLKDKYSMFLVDRVTLVNQTSAVLDGYGIRHGIVQGINDRWSPRENVQVCSIQTLARRVLPRTPSLLIWDECHSQYAATKKYIENNPGAVVIGLTATPFSKGMGQFWSDVVNVIPTRNLITQGHLIEPKMYIAKSPEDKDLELNKNGEFSDESASQAGMQIVGDVVSEWVEKTYEHFGGPVKTILFSSTVEHGRELCAAFGKLGYNFQQVSYRDRDDEERATKIEEFRKPNSEIHGLVSCGVLTKGFDVPDVKCGISCKPYRKSLSSHMQEIGRVMRTHPGKDKAIWLDHSGNLERFGLEMFDVWENGAGDLDRSSKRDSKPRERSKETKEQLVCPKCSGVMRMHLCTSCDWERPPRSNIYSVAGEMQEFNAQTLVMKSRPGLRAECLGAPKKVWQATLRYTSQHTVKGDQFARKWAYSIFRSIYPECVLPSGWFDMPLPSDCDPNAFSLIEREVLRFRKEARI